METRDILDYNGVKIGEITLPSSTTEAQWTQVLSAYNRPPKPIKEIIIEKIRHYKALSKDLLDELKADNSLAGITEEQSAQIFDDFGDVLQMLREGSFPTAIYRLQQKTPTAAVSQEMIDSWIAKVKACL